MSTAVHEPPPRIRVGRFVSVTGKPRKSEAPARRAEPLTPKTDEVRLLLFLGVGGAFCLIALALAGLVLSPRESAASVESALAPPVQSAANVPAQENVEPTPQPMTVQPEAVAEAPELLPDPVVFEANLTEPPPPAEVVALIPVKPESPIVQEKPKKSGACEKFGTRIVFLQNPTEAFKKAKLEKKQVFFVHLSGNFEDTAFT